jgi:hypothetical protein
MTSRLVASCFVLLLLAACAEEESGPCGANVDCPGVAACVAGACVSDPAGCESVGALADVWSGPLPGAEAATVFEAHVAVDSNGAAHVCWSGQDSAGAPVSSYARQTSWNTFEVSPLAPADGTQLRCGAIAVDDVGTPFVLSRSPAAVAALGTSGWVAVPLSGLEGPEAAGAIGGSNPVIALTPDETGGVYVAISLGLLASDQAVYLAHLSGTGLEVLLNGWSESGAHASVGHAPQVVLAADGALRVLRGDLGASVIELSDANFNLLDVTDGYLARSAAAPDGPEIRAAYFDKNFVLRVADITTSEFTPLGDLGPMLLDDSGEGLIPWEIAVDSAATAHLLIEDLSQGDDALVYRTVDAVGAAREPVIVTTSLDGDLPGMQRYALATDLCGRATIAYVEKNTETGAPALVIREGR